ncbi:hypothetical protein ALTERO38_50642 [Alteromonas sp. 38]|nr:hypothetical protein ALTER154_80625 [Alteromonas sp. 154]VXB42109.1 hypothetical protein ALTERO38_50642 [Alteromonas sp. 38]
MLLYLLRLSVCFENHVLLNKVIHYEKTFLFRSHLREMDLEKLHGVPFSDIAVENNSPHHYGCPTRVDWRFLRLIC